MSERTLLKNMKFIEDRLPSPTGEEGVDQKRHLDQERRTKKVIKEVALRALELTRRSTTAAALFAASGLLSSIPKSTNLHEYDPMYGFVKGESKDLFDARRRRMVDYFGEEIVREQIPVQLADLDATWREERRASERHEHPPVVEGFEQELGLSHQTIERLLVEGYPRGFGGEAAVERIRYTLEHIPFPYDYGIRGYEGGHCTVATGEGASEVVLTVDGVPSESVESPAAQIDFSFGPLLSHEVAHASDWQNAEGVVPEVRLRLLEHVVHRLEDDSAIFYPYVDRIHHPHGDKQRERLRKAKEYFAELMSDAFRVPASRFQADRDPVVAIATNLAFRHGGEVSQYVPDAQLVVQYVKALDQNFSWERAAQRRASLLSELANDRSQMLIERVVQRLGRPLLAQALLETLEQEDDDRGRQVPASLFIVEGDMGMDEVDDVCIRERLGRHEVQHFHEIRTRVRTQWSREVEQVLEDFPLETRVGAKVLRDLMEVIRNAPLQADRAQSMLHRHLRDHIDRLNHFFIEMNHEPELLRQFEECALTFVSVAIGDVTLPREDHAALVRYAKILLEAGREERAERMMGL